MKTIKFFSVLATATFFFSVSSHAQFVNEGTTPNTSNQITNGNVGIDNLTPGSNLTIGTQQTGSNIINPTMNVPTPKIFLQEANPFIYLQDVTSDDYRVATPQSTTGIKFITSSKTFSIASRPLGVLGGSGLIIKDETNAATPRISLSNGKLFIGGSVESGAPMSTNKGNILLTDNTVVTGTLLVGDGTGGVTMPSPLVSGGYSLYVKYGILTERVKVATAGTVNWADFVFQKNYVLRPLSEVESFIKENHHLPEIPSQEEVDKNGVDLLEMDAKLLQKVEELTLYMIEMKKENEQLKQTTEELKKEIQLLQGNN